MSGRSDSPDLVRAGGRLLGVGVSGVRLTAPEKEILARVAPAAVVLFARNVESEAQVRELIASIREASDPVPVFMIDEEGGRVDRLRSLVPGIPAPEDLAGFNDPGTSQLLGEAIGLLLAELDIEVNLAPVVDLSRGELSPSLVGRCFGSTPDSVATHAGAFIRGMANKGVLACLKHFPGLGVARTDPHHEASVVDLTLDEMEAGDLLPYRLLGDMAPAIMTTHGIYPRIDASGLPGTLSRFISTTLLRDHLGYRGLAVTDDMEMHAVADLSSAPDIAEQSILAGNDLVLFCSRIDEAPAIALQLGRLSKDDVSMVRASEAREHVDRFVRQCGAWTERREKARGGIDRVREAVAILRSNLGLA
jgi:beta-N-acetylhexosaminidase